MVMVWYPLQKWVTLDIIRPGWGHLCWVRGKNAADSLVSDRTTGDLDGPGPALARPWPDPRGPGSSWPRATGQLAWPDPRGPGPRASKSRLALARTGPWTVYGGLREKWVSFSIRPTSGYLHMCAAAVRLI